MNASNFSGPVIFTICGIIWTATAVLLGLLFRYLTRKPKVNKYGRTSPDFYTF